MTDYTAPARAQELLDLIAQLAARRWYQQQLNDPPRPEAVQTTQDNPCEDRNLVGNRRTGNSKKRASLSTVRLKE